MSSLKTPPKHKTYDVSCEVLGVGDWQDIEKIADKEGYVSLSDLTRDLLRHWLRKVGLL